MELEDIVLDSSMTVGLAMADVIVVRYIHPCRRYYHHI